ncbi:hypothetical protein NE562_09895 [Butyricicoccus faecihominis]|uniref:hypothetical protein n=1 Tax=Butyricicoccus faecihominis TaxID=1712515 RepID=UPI00247ACF26|nr:hypothetical protein [Butyricicoccus faecihominis]MCQ5129972.1 hypothetical protein [Butyricicoccus faecihominis]
MKNLKDRIGNANSITLAFAAVLVVAILAFAYITKTAALILLAALAIGALPIASAPTPAEVADAAGVFLERACTALKGRLAVFRDLHFDTVPVEGGGTQNFPRWEWHITYPCGVPVVRLGLLRLSQTALAPDTLTQERRVLQDLLSDNLRRGQIPLAYRSAFRDGTPTLYLLEIKEEGAYIVFDFVWIADKKAADFVHRFDLPPTGGNVDDQDF